MDDEEFKTLQQGEHLVPKLPKPKKIHDKLKVMECQPTSSKVKIEDMIMDKEEKILEEQVDATTS